MPQVAANIVAFLMFKFSLLVFIGRAFVKRFPLCYRTIVCLSETLVYCIQRVGWIKMKLGIEVGLRPRHNLLDGDHTARSSPKGAQQLPFMDHVYCGQTVAHLC